ncbi:hypothetical protein MMC18_000384 [Xylographa bjoerkii]|nr:hypothetical protein [Xylographa bjoerkii]
MINFNGNFNLHSNSPVPSTTTSTPAVHNVRPKVSDDNHHRAFNILPPEIIDRVAFFLPRDRDICNLENTCLRTHAAISHPRSGIWIQRFSDTFDVPASIRGVGVDFQLEYKSRQWIRKLVGRLRIHVVGGIGSISAASTNEGVVIEFIRELIDDSFAVVHSRGLSLGDRGISKNIKHLAEISANSCFLDNCMRFASNEELSFPQLQLYRLILTHLALDETAKIPYCFEYSQKAVYGHPMEFPLFTDGLTKRKLNLNNLLHIVNFFKYHITNADEYSLHEPFRALPDDEKPKPWDSPLKAGLQKLGTHWKGCAAYLHNSSTVSSHLRSNNTGYCPKEIIVEAQNHINNTRPYSTHIYSDVMDIEDNDDGFASLHLDFTRPTAPWPATFEKHLNSFPSMSNLTVDNGLKCGNGEPKNEDTNRITKFVPKAKAGETYHQFQGFGHDYDKYRCVGNVTALPAQDPQGVYEVDGFQRVTMMKWAEYDEKNSPRGSQTLVEKHLEEMQNYDIADVADVEHWAYEGIVLPGGKVMLVRVVLTAIILRI